MKRVILSIFIFSLLAASASSQSAIKIGSAAPEFSGVGLDGTPYDLDALRGSVVVMTFWSTRCAICHSELPKLNRFAEKFGSNVVMLALSMENSDKINGYLRQNAFKFKAVPDSFGTVLKYADRDRYGNLDMGFPSFFVIDKDGMVRHRSSGYDKTDQLAASVAKLLSN